MPDKFFLLEHLESDTIKVLGLFTELELAWAHVRTLINGRIPDYAEYSAYEMELNKPQEFKRENLHYFGIENMEINHEENH